METYSNTMIKITTNKDIIAEFNEECRQLDCDFMSIKTYYSIIDNESYCEYEVNFQVSEDTSFDTLENLLEEHSLNATFYQFDTETGKLIEKIYENGIVVSFRRQKPCFNEENVG